MMEENEIVKIPSNGKQLEAITLSVERKLLSRCQSNVDSFKC